MLTCFGIGCFSMLALLIVAVLVGIMFIGLGTETVMTEKETNITMEACYQGEIFNEDEQICMLDIKCTGIEECTRWGDNIVGNLTQTYGPLDQFTYADDEILEERIVMGYDIVKNVVQDSDIPAEYLWQWQDFEWMTPDEYTEIIDSVEIFEGNETNAYVKVIEGTHATLGLNTEPFIGAETIQNNVHELAHLISLHQDEVDYSIDEEDCETLYTEEGGCFYADSYMYQFYQAFWADASLTASRAYFINDYALSHEQEDFAESFTYFVLYPKPKEETVIHQKLAFFYQYGELVKLRTELLARIATWLPRTQEITIKMEDQTVLGLVFYTFFNER